MVFVAWTIRCVFWEWFCVVVVSMLFCTVVWCEVSLLRRLCVVGAWIWADHSVLFGCVLWFCIVVPLFFCFPCVLLLVL